MNIFQTKAKDYYFLYLKSTFSTLPSSPLFSRNQI